MNIDSIKDGVVLDHIKAGKAMEIYELLGLNELDCQVAIITNAKSEKTGKKVKTGLTFPIRFAIIILALKNRKPNQTGKPEKRQKKLKKLLTKTETCDKL